MGVRMVRLTYYDVNTDQQVEVIDLPDNCSIRTAIRSLAGRDWEEVNKLRYTGDKAWMFNTTLGRRVCIEEIVTESGLEINVASDKDVSTSIV